MQNTPLTFRGFIPLPENKSPGGFDHAAIHTKSRQLYVAHTANDTLDIIDLKQETFSRSLSGLTGIAGALVSDAQDLVFTSNRGEDTVGIFEVSNPTKLRKVSVGSRPNGLAYDAKAGLLLVAHVGLPNQPETYSVALVHVATGEVVRTLPVPGRTRWAIFDAKTNCFYVNIGTPAQIIVIESTAHPGPPRLLPIPGDGPHGLDLDPQSGRLFCACDGRQLVTIEATTGRVIDQAELTGTPDVIFYNANLKHLYVAIGDPGVIDVFDTDTMKKLGTSPTEKGAHTIAFDAETNRVYAFLPQSHRAAVYQDQRF